MTTGAKPVLQRIEWVGIGLFALLLPVTSSPLVAKLIGGTMVAPLSALVLLALLAVWFVPYLLRGGQLPPQTLPLFGFLLAGLVASGAAFFYAFPPRGDAVLWRNELEAILSLGLGILFYLLMAAWPCSEQRVKFVLRWINWSGLLTLLWAFFQMVIWHTLHTYPDWMWEIHSYYSTSQLIYQDRAIGFAYEPSWLAHQLNMLYLPFWIASALTGFSAHRFRLWKIRFEHLLLVGGLAVMWLSVSRIGLLGFLAMAAYVMLLLNIRFVNWLVNKVISRRQLDAQQSRRARRIFATVSYLVLIVVYLGIMLGAGYLLSQRDPRMARLFDFSIIKEASFFHYANQLVFAERIVFWHAGWEVFNDYPILGVGLGNAGFLFNEKLSAFSWALTEVRTLMFQSSVIPNIKSLWVRLLAETGIVGFAFFLCWCYVIWQSARFLNSQANPFSRAVGLAGNLVLVALLMEGFSIDTFALPYYWVSLGLVTAACEIARRSCLSSGHFASNGGVD